MSHWSKRSVCAIVILAGVLMGQAALAADAAPGGGPAAKEAPPPLPAYFSGANADARQANVARSDRRRGRRVGDAGVGG